MKTLLNLTLALLVCAPLAAQPAQFTLDGSLRLRIEDWSWFEASQGRHDYTFLGSILRVGVARDNGRVGWRLEAAQPTLVGLPDDATAPAPQGQLGLGATYYGVNGERDDAGLFLKQAFVNFHGFSNAGDWLRIGRFELIDGTESMPKDAALAAVKRSRIAHRLIGNFGFTHVGRSFDGLQYFHQMGESNLTIAAVRPTEGVFSVDGWDELDVDVAYAAYTRSAADVDARLFAIAYRDHRGLRKNDNVSAPDTEDAEIATMGGHYLRGFSLGTAKGDLLLWGAWQTGDWGALDHDAYAWDVELGIRPQGRWKPALRFGWFRGSGDPNGTDRKHETFFQVLPTPRIYARFPFYNHMNNEDRFVQLALEPADAVSLVASWHDVSLAESADLWYAGGGAFNDSVFGYPGRPSGGFTDLATVFDVGLDWRVSKTLSASFYLGVANGGHVIDSIYPDDSSAGYVFVEVTKKFSTKL